VNALVVDTKLSTAAQAVEAVSEADGGMEGYESDNDTNANDSSI
jgi:hypothetical protein